MFDPEEYLQVVLKMPGGEPSPVAIDRLCEVNFADGHTIAIFINSSSGRWLTGINIYLIFPCVLPLRKL